MARPRFGKFFLKSFALLLRAAGLLVLLLVLLSIGAAVIFQRMFTPESIKAIVVSELQNVLKRPVEVQNVHFVLHQGIRVQGLRVRETDGFGGPEFIASDLLIAKYKWRALLLRRLELSELRLVSPRIQVVRRDDERWNIGNIFVSTSTQHAEAGKGAFKLPFSLAADVIAVDHGEILVEDQVRRHRYVFKGVDLRVSEFDPSNPFVIEGAFENTSGLETGDVQAQVSFKGSLDLADFRWDDAYLSAERIRGTVEQKTFSASASLKDFRRPKIELNAKLPPVDTAYIRRFWSKTAEGIALPASQLKVRLAFPATGQLLLDQAEAVAEDVHLSAKGSLVQDGETRRWRITASAPPTSLKAAARLWTGFALHELTGTGSGSVTLSGAFSKEPTPIRLEAMSFSATGLGGVFFKPKHRFLHADGSMTAKDNFDDLSFTVTRGTAVIYGTPFSDVNLAVQMRKGDLAVDHLSLTWDASRLKLKGRLKDFSSPKEVRVDATVDKLRLDQAIADGTRIASSMKPAESGPRSGRWSQIFKYSFPKKFPAISGTLTVKEVFSPAFETQSLRALWNLDGLSTGLAKANGDVEVRFGPGRVIDIQRLEEASKILRVLFLPFVFMHRLNNLAVIAAATAYPKSLDFTVIAGSYGLKAGIVDMAKFHVDSGVLKAFADGTVDFPAEKVSLHVLTKLARERGALPEYLTDEEGRPAIGFFVENDLNKPDLRIDLHKQESDAIERAVLAADKRRKPVFKNLEGGGP